MESGRDDEVLRKTLKDLISDNIIQHRKAEDEELANHKWRKNTPRYLFSVNEDKLM